jgi:hypothetical protein
MTPEMRDSADTADPGPADIWAWRRPYGFLTGIPLPLPGTHRYAKAVHALQQRITCTFAAELDLLLEEATQIDPQAL